MAQVAFEIERASRAAKMRDDLNERVALDTAKANYDARTKEIEGTFGADSDPTSLTERTGRELDKVFEEHAKTITNPELRQQFKNHHTRVGAGVVSRAKASSIKSQQTQALGSLAKTESNILDAFGRGDGTFDLETAMGGYRSTLRDMVAMGALTPESAETKRASLRGKIQETRLSRDQAAAVASDSGAALTAFEQNRESGFYEGASPEKLQISRNSTIKEWIKRQADKEKQDEERVEQEQRERRLEILQLIDFQKKNPNATAYTFTDLEQDVRDKRIAPGDQTMIFNALKDSNAPSDDQLAIDRLEVTVTDRELSPKQMRRDLDFHFDGGDITAETRSKYLKRIEQIEKDRETDAGKLMDDKVKAAVRTIRSSFEESNFFFRNQKDDQAIATAINEVEIRARKGEDPMTVGAEVIKRLKSDDPFPANMQDIIKKGEKMLKGERVNMSQLEMNTFTFWLSRNAGGGAAPTRQLTPEEAAKKAKRAGGR